MAKCITVSIVLALFVVMTILNGAEAVGRGFPNYPLEAPDVDPKDYCRLCNEIMPWFCFSCVSPTRSPTIQ
jgi:hypothetical protein